MIYLVIFLFLLSFSFFDINLKFGSNSQLLYFIVIIVFILLAGLRNMGYDFANYNEIFDSLSFGSKNNAVLDLLIEPGFSLFVKILKLLGLGFYVLIFVFAFFSVILKTAFFSKYSAYPFVSLLIYFSIAYLIKDMGQIRHGLAMAIVLMSFVFVFKKKTFAFFLFVLLAFTIHASAIAVIPVYWLANITIRPRYLIAALVVLFPLLFIDLRPVFLSFLGFITLPQVQSKATFYLYSEEFGSPLGLNISVILRVLIFLGMLAFYQNGKNNYSFYPQLVTLYFYGLFLYILFNSVSDFAIRTSDYFKLLDCIILPFFITLGKNRTQKSLLWSLAVLYSSWSIFKLLSDNTFLQEYTPYRTFLTMDTIIYSHHKFI